MTDKRQLPLQPVCGIQILRDREWALIDATVQHFRNIKSEGVRISSKSVIRYEDLQKYLSYTASVCTQAFCALRDLNIIWALGSPNQKLRYHISVKRLNKLVQAHKNLSWFTSTTLIPTLVFAYKFGKGTIEDFKREVHNHYSILDKRKGRQYEDELYTHFFDDKEITFTLTDKGRKLMDDLINFNDLLAEWAQEECSIFTENYICTDDYDPRQASFLGMMLNQNPKRQFKSKWTMCLVVYANIVTKEATLRVNTNYGKHTTILQARAIPAYFRNHDPDSLFSGWCPIPAEHAADPWAWAKDIEDSFMSQGYEVIRKCRPATNSVN